MGKHDQVSAAAEEARRATGGAAGELAPWSVLKISRRPVAAPPRQNCP